MDIDMLGESIFFCSRLVKSLDKLRDYFYFKIRKSSTSQIYFPSIH
ncbi:hypothetical protein FM106_28855 [Brachybacterium faecium]|nr:hypothetical protein FM106_28855 [Brachybacterium faecium]